MGFINNENNTRNISEKMPPQTGFSRLWEVLSRDYINLMSAGAFALISIVLFAFGISFSLISKSVLILFLSGVIGGIIAAPQIVGLFDTVLRGLRDQPFLWWLTYKQSWKRNFRSSLFPGALIGLVLAFQIFAFHILPFDKIPMWSIILFLLSVILSVGLAMLMFIQIPLMELRFCYLFRNAVMLFIRFFPKVFLMSLLTIVYFLLCIRWMPADMLILLILNCWCPALLGTMIIYRHINEVFQIEKRLAEKENAKNGEEF